MKFHIVPASVNVPALRQQLFGDNHIPKGAYGDYVAVRLVDQRNIPLGSFRLTVVPHTPHPAGPYGNVKKSSKARIFVKCSCGREVPVGRLAQHVHHIPDYSAEYLTEVLGVDMTAEQAASLNRVCMRYQELPKSLGLEVGRNPALMCNFGTIVIGIEPDGHAHS